MGQYGEVTCPHCGEERDVEWDDIESQDLLDENNVIEMECDKCHKTFGFTIYVEYSANEAFDIPCKNGEGHEWRDLTKYMSDDQKEEFKKHNRIWQECDHCGREVKTQKEKDKLDLEQEQIKKDLEEYQRDEGYEEEF